MRCRERERERERERILYFLLYLEEGGGGGQGTIRGVHRSLEGEVETRSDDDHHGHKDENANLVGRYEPAPTVEATVTMEPLVILRRHEWSVLHHLLRHVKREVSAQQRVSAPRSKRYPHPHPYQERFHYVMNK